jgi:hypothetical protein
MKAYLTTTVQRSENGVEKTMHEAGSIIELPDYDFDDLELKGAVRKPTEEELSLHRYKMAEADQAERAKKKAREDRMKERGAERVNVGGTDGRIDNRNPPGARTPAVSGKVKPGPAAQGSIVEAPAGTEPGTGIDDL